MQLSLQVLAQLSQFFWPQACLVCHQRSHAKLPLCNDCYQQLPWLPKSHCLRCALPLEGVILGTQCGQCLQKPPTYKQTIALFSYAAPIDKLISSLKFQRRLVVSRLLGTLLAEEITRCYQSHSLPELIIPVPLHKQRLRERGYNQTVELAKPIAQKLKIPINRYDCQRIIATQPQTNIPATERQKNLRNAFHCQSITARHVAIVDDVVTTSSTVRELARSLHKIGVEQIDVWCVARTPNH